MGNRQVYIPALDLEILGVRIECFKGPARHSYLGAWWKWFDDVMTQKAGSRFIAIGDFNTDTDRTRAKYGTHLKRIAEGNWHFPSPENGISYFEHNRRPTSRIDHALVSKLFAQPTATYVTKYGPYTYAGESGALSDHAPLILDMDCATSTKMPRNFPGRR